ncbi:MAG: class I SAM-dependent methyltransferase [Dehalococcoidia bacterium]|nr:class I SAM-dependent methyltransferase [Dehalococcoidia bacterium]
MVLDLGCGTGELARPLAPHVERVDAVDTSEEMIRLGRKREGGGRSNIRWIHQSAEEFPYETRYALVVAGASIHWMDWHVVLPKLGAALSPRGHLAIVGGHEIAAPWVEELNGMLPRYSTNEHFGRFNVIDELQQRNLFVAEGRTRTSARQHRVSVETYVELLHARNGFSRQRMAAETAHEFDAAVRDLVFPYAHQKMLLLDMATTITWGHPTVRASDMGAV